MLRFVVSELASYSVVAVYLPIMEPFGLVSRYRSGSTVGGGRVIG
jgi:hypothetical protein